MELEHQRESLSCDTKKSQTAAAVDLSQFRNEEIGKGYQAKHVVRQREAAADSSGVVVDMSGGAFQSDGKKEKKKSSKKDKKSSKRKRDTAGDKQETDSRLDTYLRCKGLKKFLEDIDKMLS